MYRRRVSAVIAAICVVAVAAVHGQSVPTIVGTWKLNTEKSNLPPMRDGWFDIRQYSVRPDGYLVGILFTFNARGYHYLQFTAKSDGKEYPEFTDDLLADLIASGTQTTRTYAETIVNEYVTQWTDRVNGQVTGSGRKIVSSDGKTLTITVDGSTQLRIYDRQ